MPTILFCTTVEMMTNQFLIPLEMKPNNFDILCNLHIHVAHVK